MNCCQRETIDKHFGKELVEEELRRYERKGPNATTRILLDGLKAQNLGSATCCKAGEYH